MAINENTKKNDKLIISNYSAQVGKQLTEQLKREDDILRKSAKGIVDQYGMGKGVIIVSEVLHTDVHTSNMWGYVSKGMSASVESFYNPGFTPFLMHHNDGADNFMPADHTLVSVGTNLFAKHIKRNNDTSRGLSTGYVKVATFVSENKKIGNENVIDLLKSRNLMQLSVGSSVRRDNYVCSICNNPYRQYDSDDAKKNCDHIAGKIYDSKLCYIQLHKPRFKEYSATYDPADTESLIKSVFHADSDGSFDDVSDDNVEISNFNDILGSMSIYDSQQVYSSVDFNNNKENDMEIKEIVDIIAPLTKSNLEKDQEIADLKDKLAKSNETISIKDQEIKSLKESDSNSTQDAEALKLEIKELKDSLVLLVDDIKKIKDSKSNSGDGEGEEESEGEGEGSDNTDSDGKGKNTKKTKKTSINIYDIRK